MRGKRIILTALGAMALAALAARAPAAAKPAAEADPKSTKPATRPAEPDKASPGEKLFAEGRDAMFRGDYKKAIELLTGAVAADKSKTRYRLALARAHRYAGNMAQAEKLLTEILAASPDHVEAGQILGEVYTRQEKWKQAVKVLEGLLKYRHDYPTYHMLAEAKYNLDDHEKARKYFEEAIKLNPNSASDHYQLGNIYLAGNSFAMAAASYRKALSLGLHAPVLHYKLASAYFNLRNYFGRVREVTVKSGKPGTISGSWYLIEPVPGRKDVFRAAPSNSAIYQIAKAIDAGLKDQPDIRFLRANIYLNARRYRQAYDMFKAIEATTPKEDKALFYYYFAQAAFGVGNYDEHLTLLKKAIELDEKAYKATLVDAYVRVAEQRNQRGDLDGYIRYLKMAVAEAPKKASLHLKLGNAYEEARKYPQAAVQWRMVLDLETDHPQRMKLLDLIGKYSSAGGQPTDKKPAKDKPAAKPTVKPAANRAA